MKAPITLIVFGLCVGKMLVTPMVGWEIAIVVAFMVINVIHRRENQRIEKASQTADSSKEIMLLQVQINELKTESDEVKKVSDESKKLLSEAHLAMGFKPRSQR